MAQPQRSQPTHPTLSVVVTSFNRADVVLDTIDSIVDSLDGHSFEVVVEDDGSTDGTRERLATITDERVRVIERDNHGLAVARNRGIEATLGEWVAFCDDDDAFLPGWGTDLFPLLADDALGYVAGAAELVDESGRPTGVDGPHDLGPLYQGFRGHYLAGSFAVRRSVLMAAGGYLPALSSSHQSELLMRVAACCVDAGLGAASTSVPVARIERRAAGDRPMQNPRWLLDGTRWILARHHERFDADPDELASWNSVAAVAAARLEQWDVARHFADEAVRTRPGRPAAWVRAAVMRVPALARRKWSAAAVPSAGASTDPAPLRSSVASLRAAGADTTDRFFLPWRYVENAPNSADRDGTPFWEDGVEGNDVRYQHAVYRWAARLARTAAPVVLDVGCGSGDKLANVVAPAAGTTIGVDQASGIRLATERFPDLRWITADLADDEAWDELVGLRPDLTICSDVVEHVEDPIELLQRLGRVAGDTGRVLVSTPDRARLESVPQSGPPRNPRHIREWNADEFRLLLEASGFEVLEERHFLPRRYSPTRTDLNRFVYRLLHLRPVPDRRSSMAFLVRPQPASSPTIA